jgi:hypothetical protein
MEETPTEDQLVVRRMYKLIERQDSRNARRRNARLLQSILKRSTSWETSVTINLNLAELLYNGVPGIPTDMERCMALYVGTLEAASAHVLQDTHFIGFLKNNMIEVSSYLGHDCLQETTSRLFELSKTNDNDNLRLIHDMMAARAADLGSRPKQAIRFYKSAKVLCDKIEDKMNSLESEKRIAVLKSRYESTEVNGRIEQKYSELQKKAFGAQVDVKECRTEGPRPKYILRGTILVDEAEDPPSELLDLIQETGGTWCESKCNVCESCGEPNVAHRFKKCNGCGKARYCSKKCQKSHWSEHKRSCRS